MKLKVAIGAAIGVLALWGVVATALWATGDSGPVIVTTVTVEQP